MAIDRITPDADADAERVEEKPRTERPSPPPDRPGTPGYPSRAESRRNAQATSESAHESTMQTPEDVESSSESDEAEQVPEGHEARPGDRRGYPVDASVAGDRGLTPEIPEFTPEQRTRLREAENKIRDFAESYGVRVDYSTHPIDPANAIELNKAITRLAHEYPNVFRKIENIKTLDPDGMAEVGSGPRTLGHTIHRGDRLLGGEPLESGIYLSQMRFADKQETDRVATKDKMNGYNVSGTAEGTLYHEFGHVIFNQISNHPSIKKDLAQELRGSGIVVDEDGFSPKVPPGWLPVLEGLGIYATENSKEMIAEGFSEWKLDTHPRPIATAIGTAIDRHFKAG